ncbi:MAG: cytochrome c peroxidase [Chitinophagaceae bacterium]
MKPKLTRAFVMALLVFIVIYQTAFNMPDKELPATSAQLGELLFNDKILSGDNTVSCASCHKPQFAFADTVARSEGVNGNLTGRNTPTAMYLEKNTVLFWDGRAGSLEQQASGPITNEHEMNLSIKQAVKKLNANMYYLSSFKKIYGRQADSTLLVRSIADFERTLSYYDAPYDRFLKGDENAMNASAIRGFELFHRKNSCGNSACHNGTSFFSDSMVNIGIFNETDKGLFDRTKNPADIGRFKSPTLRNIELTAPYMHDGQHKTLREVIDYYNDMKNFPYEGNTHPDVKEQRDHPLNEQEINDIIEFLKALTDYRLKPKKA